MHHFYTLYLQKPAPADHRRKWDKDEYEKIAQARLEEEQRKILEKELKEPPIKRELLKPREYKVSCIQRCNSYSFIFTTSIYISTKPSLIKQFFFIVSIKTKF